jgi:hypothetical protein
MGYAQEGKGRLGRDYERYLETKDRRNAKVRSAYRRERSLAKVAQLFKLSRARVSQIVNRG